MTRVRWIEPLLFAAALAAGCSSGPAGPGPGDTQPGDPCDKPADCYCWQCTCEGIGGAPGAAQLCKSDGHCPTGDEACGTVCSLANAKVAKATPVEMCPAVP